MGTLREALFQKGVCHPHLLTGTNLAKVCVRSTEVMACEQDQSSGVSSPDVQRQGPSPASVTALRLPKEPGEHCCSKPVAPELNVLPSPASVQSSDVTAPLSGCFGLTA